MYPEDLVDQFRNLRVKEMHETPSGNCEPGVSVTTPIKNYVTGLTHARIQIRSALNKFLARKAADPNSCIFDWGDQEWVMYCADPIYHISDKSILRVLTGKGTVTEIRDVLKIVSLMLEEQSPNKALGGCRDLRQFVDEHVGHDCNGFVFSYLRTAHGHKAQTDKKCGQYREGVLRQSVADIRELDMVFSTNAGHILIIGRIVNRKSDSVECYISESRSTSLGGAQAHRYKVKKNKDGTWQLNFLSKCEHDRTMGTIWGSPLTHA